MNAAAARIAREAADAFEAREPGRPRYVCGAIGPTNRTASISPDVSDPGARNVRFDDLVVAYGEAAAGLVEGGADLLVVETIFDTLNAKAAIFAIDDLFERLGFRLPLMISGTITDASGRTLSGQTPEAFWHSVRHARPFSVGLNCALGAKALRSHVQELAQGRRRADLGLPERRPPERVRRLRRDRPGDLRGAPRVRRGRPGQHRRRLLRDDAGPRPGDRRGGPRSRASTDSGRTAR